MDPKIQIRTEKIPLLLNQTNKKLNMFIMYNNKNYYSRCRALVFFFFSKVKIELLYVYRYKLGCIYIYIYISSGMNCFMNHM